MTGSANLIRVLLVDDHAVFRAGVRAILSAVPEITAVGEASDGIEALTLIQQLEPDVVVMDLDMPGGDGATATAAIAKMHPRPKVLVLTVYSEQDRLIPLLAAGASGFLSKDADGEELIKAIRIVAAGDAFIRPGAAGILAAGIRHVDPSRADEARAKFSKLSDRERQVLRQIAEGYNGVEIGSRIGVSSKTVETYKQRIAQKIGLGHRADYVRFALTSGLLVYPGHD